LTDEGVLLGVITRHNVLEAEHDGEIVRRLLRRPPAVAFDNSSLREAADLMVKEGVGRLPVVSRAEPGKVVGILTRSDLLSAHGRRLDENAQRDARMKLPFVRIGARGPGSKQSPLA
jgi:predicted transcriptional regulator